MDWPGALALLISIAAVISAVRYAATQNVLQSRANHLTATFQVLEAFRSPTPHENYYRLCRELPSLDPTTGLSGLDPDLRRCVYDVVYWLHNAALLMMIGAVDEEGFMAIFQVRAVKTWEAIAPFVEHDRKNPLLGEHHLRVLEVLADKAERMPMEPVIERLGRWARAHPARTAPDTAGRRRLIDLRDKERGKAGRGRPAR